MSNVDLRIFRKTLAHALSDEWNFLGHYFNIKDTEPSQRQGSCTLIAFKEHEPSTRVEFFTVAVDPDLGPNIIGERSEAKSLLIRKVQNAWFVAETDDHTDAVHH